MAYTPVPTKNPGDIITAAIWNTYIRDNFAAGVPDIFTLKGDLAVGTGADTVTRLPVGNTYDLLTPDPGEASGLLWTPLQDFTVPARATRSVVQSIPNNTITLIEFDSEIFDVAGAFTTGAAAKYTAPVTGYYLVESGVALITPSWDNGEEAILRVYKDGVVEAVLDEFFAIGTYMPGATFLSGSVIVQLNATQYVDIRIFQRSGGAVNTTSLTACHVSVCRVG